MNNGVSDSSQDPSGQMILAPLSSRRGCEMGAVISPYSFAILTQMDISTGGVGE